MIGGMGGELATRMVGRTVGGMAGGTVSVATRQTPQIDDNTLARGGITMYNGVWRVDKPTIPPTVPPAIPPTIPRPSSRPSLRAVLHLRGLGPYCLALWGASKSGMG